MNIFVSRLNFKTTDEGLKDLFANYGEVTSAKIINDRESGRSRGFGFVEMANDEEGQAAIDALNETDFEGRTIGVNVARPREERPERRSYGNNRGGGYGNNDGGYNRRRY